MEGILTTKDKSCPVQVLEELYDSHRRKECHQISRQVLDEVEFHLWQVLDKLDESSSGPTRHARSHVGNGSLVLHYT